DPRVHSGSFRSWSHPPLQFRHRSATELAGAERPILAPESSYYIRAISIAAHAPARTLNRLDHVRINSPVRDTLEARETLLRHLDSLLGAPGTHLNCRLQALELMSVGTQQILEETHFVLAHGLACLCFAFPARFISWNKRR